MGWFQLIVLLFDGVYQTNKQTIETSPVRYVTLFIKMI